MTPNQYFLFAFAITIVLLVGYPLYMWMEHRSLARRELMARHDRDAGTAT
jgi:uncharacterized iron-regulated membrane protein